MAKGERVVVYGLAWFRYPDSKRVSDRRYFRHGGMYLHRLVWEVHHGEIPDKHHVHHKDGDTGNNEIGNLELLPGSEHLSRHHKGKCSDAKRANLARVRPLTVEWHQSEEGRQWHRDHARAVIAKIKPQEKTCERCGGLWIATMPKRTDRFCSLGCKAAARRDSGVDDVDKTCDECGGTYRANRYIKRRYCGPPCARGARRRAQMGVQPDGR